MHILLRIFGPPHEGLHVLALWLVGRRPRRVARTHIDLPDNLTLRQYVFVAGFPAPVFGVGALPAVAGLLNAATPGQTAAAVAALLVFGPALAGTVSDIEQIFLRLQHGVGHNDRSHSDL